MGGWVAAKPRERVGRAAGAEGVFSSDSVLEGAANTVSPPLTPFTTNLRCHPAWDPQVRGVCVVLPPGATFVIANSLAVSNKAETAPKR